MNIFYLDEKPRVAAQMHCDKHVVKMVLEYAQILSTAHRVCDGDEVADREGLYKATHKNHPSAVWARQSIGNYDWLSDLWGYLGSEYHHRYGKVHKSATIAWLFYAPDFIPKKAVRSRVLCPPPQCMPDEYKCNPSSASSNDTVSAYQAYYIGDKARFAKWTKRPTPEWFKGLKTLSPVKSGPLI
jgi:hypothetical protein